MLHMPKKYLITLLLISALFLLGCDNLRNAEKKNIPFTILEQGNYTLDALTKAAPQPVIAVFDSSKDFNKAYSLIKKETEPLDINWDNELVIVVLRGNNGACKNAGIDIRKISQDRDKAIIEVLKDNGEEKSENCSIEFNPYMIVELNKEQFVSYADLTYQLVDQNQELLAEDTISFLPEFLKK